MSCGCDTIPVPNPAIELGSIANEGSFIFWNAGGEIDVHLLYEFFNREGIKLFFPEDSKWKKSEALIVKMNNNIVSEINVGYLLSLARKHILECTEEEGNHGAILNSLHKKVSFFSDKNLKLLKKADIEFLTDTRDAAYFPFINGVVEIKKESIELKAYDEFDQYIWEESIVQRDYEPFSEEQLVDSCDFNRFIEDLVRVENEEHRTSRKKALQSAVGYLSHRYKDPAVNKAVVLMDIFVNGMPNGGSGKTLISTAIGKLRNQSIIDGKSYDQKRWFRLSTVEMGTELLLFDDVKKDFDVEQVFPLMTTGMHIQRKHKDDYFIAYEKSPKIVITTNYALNGESSSFRRRIYEFEVSDTYNAENTPRDKFGRNFFDEWEDTDWIKFYNTMFHCIQIYLEDGLLESEPINIKYSKLINNTSLEFIEFAQTNITINSQLDKKSLFAIFIAQFPDFKVMLKQRTFTEWLKRWGEFKKYKVTEGHTGNMRYIVYSEKPTP